MKRIKEFFRLLKLTFVEFNDDNAIKLSASLAYYTVFSIGPLILVAISIAGIFIEQQQISGVLYEQIRSLSGESVARMVLDLSNNMRLERKANIYSIIGLVILFFGATSVFSDMQNSINYIFAIKAKPKRGWLKFITDRLTSFSLVISIGFILMVALMINTLADLFTNKITRFIPEGNYIIIQVCNFLVLITLITTLFTIIYKVLPDAIIRWKDALVGALFTSIMFILGKYLISYYLSTSNMSVTYGAAASVILLLTWVYYSATILYFGAEFTKVYAVEKGNGIKVYKNAVFIEKTEVHELPHKKTEGTTEQDKTLLSLEKEAHHDHESSTEKLND